MPFMVVKFTGQDYQSILREGEFYFNRLNKPEGVYLSKNVALDIARASASKSPGSIVGIFEMLDVYEAKKPEIVNKKVNERGEIVSK